MSLLFIIKCQEEKYYLGLAKNFVSIFFKHLENHDNIHWMNIYKPMKLMHIEHFFNLKMLNNCVIYYMYIYGIENVRGGIYSDLILNLNQYDKITKKINEIYNDNV
tara:strand:- start:216 stop:533 length:318 start_codon:yes stop_codon:yes gene_type:complete